MQKFEREEEGLPSNGSQNSANGGDVFDDDGNAIDPRSAEGIKLKYARAKAQVTTQQQQQQQQQQQVSERAL